MSKLNLKFRKPRTSKLIMWIFIILFLYVIYEGVNYDFSSVTYMDTAIFCACIASAGGILGAIITKYLNNSNCENIPRIQMNLYKQSMKLRLEYNEEMMKLKQKYSITDDEVCEIESGSHMGEITDSILNNTITELDTKSAQAHEDVSIQNY